MSDDEKIIPNEIEKGHIVKVLVEGDEEYYASVLSNEGEYLFVTYFTPIGKNYKTAPVHSFEPKAEKVDFESLTEHYLDSKEIGVKKIGKNMYVFGDEIDPDSDSEIETEEDDSDSVGSLKDFVVSDSEEMGELPNDYKELDEQWNKWSPKTKSGKQFKRTIDQLEAITKIKGDNQRF